MSNVRDGAIQDVMSNFDFEKVQEAMTAVDWGYGLDGDEVPTIDRLKAAARELLTDVWKAGEGTVESGGFSATVTKDSEYISLKLSFVMESYRSRILI